MRLTRVALLSMVAVVTVTACNSSAKACADRPVPDPGAERTADLYGAMAVDQTDLSVSVGGVTIHPRDVSVFGNGCPTGGCYASVFVDRASGLATEIHYWPVLQPVPSDEFTINTNRFRFVDARVVVDGGFAFALDPSFSVEGCGDGDNTKERLLRDGVGATFYVDGPTGKVLRAACNGCA